VTGGSTDPVATLAKQQRGYGPPAPVPIFQWEAEFAPLLEMYRERKPKRVLEIGTYHGGTLYHWLTEAVPGAKIVTVDSYLVGVDNRKYYSGWTPAGVELDVIEGDSADRQILREVAESAPFDWIFIDAGHSYEEVATDWNNYKPMCRKKGVVIFHDILPPSRTWPDIQVWWLWKEIKRRDEFRTEEIIYDAEAEWGGIGIVYL
jgi:predicted O-methyltransferase YrrM